MPRLPVAAIALLPLLACESTATQRERVAGTYAMTSHDTLAAQFLEGTTLRLRRDGQWELEMPAAPMFRRPAGTDSGKYDVRAGEVAIHSSEGVKTYVVRGDTLVWQPAEQGRMIAQTEAITGMKLTGQVETFFVRTR